jgi:hypothetical protein
MPRLPLLPALVAAALAALLGFLLVSSVMSAGPPFPEPITDDVFDGSDELYWVLVVAVLAMTLAVEAVAIAPPA